METRNRLDEPQMNEKQLRRHLKRSKSIKQKSIKSTTRSEHAQDPSKPDPRDLFNKCQLLEFEIAFDEFDILSMGYISVNLLPNLMRSLGCNPTVKELEEYIMKYATEGQTRMMLDDFFLIMYDELNKVDHTLEAYEVS